MLYVDWTQWPAMLATVVAAWLVGSQQPRRRMAGFWLFLLSNLLWVIWGVHSQAWALIVLQGCLCVMNCRGLRRNASVIVEAPSKRSNGPQTAGNR
ncbi:hypothetical protein [Pseudomonas japonica]|uniref:hypothetical protein n=1 Tax=Pseudomonas japonica TaxID=256466 RepID=UPI0015E2BD61|nr:hypothetical protein [Pseudomonas japonica]MBA1242209.1 hypothetical protein [Pseudomonas japonica]